MIIFKKKLRYVLYLIPTLIMSFQSCSPKSNVSTKTERVNELKYTETKIDVFFNDGTNKIFDLDVYDNYEIEINNGDLTYWKVTKETEGVLAKKVFLASFVKCYSIISEIDKSIIY